jgi:hypothetical protein
MNHRCKQLGQMPQPLPISLLPFTERNNGFAKNLNTFPLALVSIGTSVARLVALVQGSASPACQ